MEWGVRASWAITACNHAVTNEKYAAGGTLAEFPVGLCLLDSLAEKS